MKVKIELPMEQFNLFVAACDATSLEYTVLKNGFVFYSRTFDSSRCIIQIMCNEDDAFKLLVASVLQCHEATGPIAAALEHARKF